MTRNDVASAEGGNYCGDPPAGVGTAPASFGGAAMARGGNLDTRTIEAAKPRAAAYRLSDGGGLLLVVKPSGARLWMARITVDGKRRDMGLGGYPAVSLREAREKAAAARKKA